MITAEVLVDGEGGYEIASIPIPDGYKFGDFIDVVSSPAYAEEEPRHYRGMVMSVTNYQ